MRLSNGLLLFWGENQALAFDSQGKQLWSHQLPAGNSIEGVTLTEDGGSLISWYDAEYRSWLSRLDSAGSAVWEQELDDCGEPQYLADGRILMLTNFGLGCFSSDVRVLWNSEIGGNMVGHYVANGGGLRAAVGRDGTAYVGTSVGDLVAIAADGQQRWVYKAGILASQPAVGPDGTIYVSSHRQALHAVNPDGTVKWVEDRLGFVNSDPTVGIDGTVYVAAGSQLYALKP
jgi:outer membrane protein assembly factor BamB